MQLCRDCATCLTSVGMQALSKLMQRQRNEREQVLAAPCQSLQASVHQKLNGAACHTDCLLTYDCHLKGEGFTASRLWGLAGLVLSGVTCPPCHPCMHV